MLCARFCLIHTTYKRGYVGWHRLAKPSDEMRYSDALDDFIFSSSCDQSYKHFTIVINDLRVVI